VGIEGVFDLGRYFQVAEKFAFKMSELEPSIGGTVRAFNYLWINRLNYHVTSKWDFAVEYRILLQDGSGESRRHGVLVEVDRELFNYVRVGLGYNFTDFDDDFNSNNNYQSISQGPFIRLTGKY